MVIRPRIAARLVTSAITATKRDIWARTALNPVPRRFATSVTKVATSPRTALTNPLNLPLNATSAVRLVISLATAPPAVTTAASTTAAVVWVARLAIPAVVLVTWAVSAPLPKVVLVAQSATTAVTLAISPVTATFLLNPDKPRFATSANNLDISPEIAPMPKSWNRCIKKMWILSQRVTCVGSLFDVYINTILAILL